MLNGHSIISTTCVTKQMTINKKEWQHQLGLIDRQISIYQALSVAMITLTNRIYPVVVIIDSQAIASTQQILRYTLWDLL